MTPTGSPTRVVALVNPGPILQQITTALSSQPEFDLLVEVSEMANQPDRLVRELQSSEPDLIIIDHELVGHSSLDLIDDLVQQMPNSDIIAIIPEDNPVRAQQVTLAGARAFIILPFTQVNMLSTLRRVRDLQARRRQMQAVAEATSADMHDHNSILAVYSPRGGAGTTSVALNLAVALAYEREGGVLLLEGKLLFGHLDVLLNVRSRNSLADLIPHATGLDETLVREVATEHISGLHILLAPSDPQYAQGIRPQDLFNLINSLERYYDQIIIDCGSALNENTVTMMDASGRILLVTNPDLAALHDISRFMRISQSLAYPAEKMLLILNRSGQEGGVKDRDIETVLHQRIFATIPEDLANAQRSLNRGIPLIMNYPRSPASKAYHDLAGKVLALAGEGSSVRAA